MASAAGHSRFHRFRRLCKNVATCHCSSCCDLIMLMGDMLMKILGPCLICVALALINAIAYVFIFTWLPVQDFGHRAVLLPLGLWIYFNIKYNFFCAMLRDAGKPPAYHSSANEPELQEFGLDSDVPSDDEYTYVVKHTTPAARQCHKCLLTKPERAHHCSVCNRCTLKMDHHCPWINNCVGWNNYRNFCLFMLYLYIGCFFIVINFFPDFWNTFYHRIAFSPFDRRSRRYVLMAFQVAGAVIVSLSILGGFHVFLMLTNQTTIELQINWSRSSEARSSGNTYRNPYDMGRRRNFQSIFGQSRFWSFKWMLPIEPCSQGDGVSWPSLFKLDV